MRSPDPGISSPNSINSFSFLLLKGTESLLEISPLNISPIDHLPCKHRKPHLIVKLTSAYFGPMISGEQ
ncbi:hypothetical protein M378DRAFT_160880 [Amanita muscaria Koide BX008]|uniref:Uncharacterized protein n=1 Tax=Amanita muscaria (strain Koide BX008) TaxID=946122 RepID=A0A0C2SSU7_AMAMK|nr:hypothetical protein M378DRAFT_160880 [Amanita muscaria Koide BX008]